MQIIISQLTLPKHVSPILVLILNKFILQTSLIDHSLKDNTKFILKNSAPLSLFTFSVFSKAYYQMLRRVHIVCGHPRKVDYEKV